MYANNVPIHSPILWKNHTDGKAIGQRTVATYQRYKKSKINRRLTPILCTGCRQ